MLGFITNPNQPISGKSGIEYFVKVDAMLNKLGRKGVVKLVLRETSPAAQYFRRRNYPDLFGNSAKSRVEENQNNDISRLVNQRPPATTHQSTSIHARSIQGQQIFNRATANANSDQEEPRERAQPAQQAQTEARVRRSRDNLLIDGLHSDLPAGTRRGTVYNVPDNQIVEESEEEAVADTHDPVTPTQDGADHHAPQGDQIIQSRPNSPVPYDADKPELDLDMYSYKARLKWLINKCGLSKEQYERERRDLEAVQSLLQSYGLFPLANALTPNSAMTTSTRSSARNYGQVADGISCKEEFDVWKIQEKRNEIALDVLSKWFSRYAQELAQEAWHTCDPGVIFDFYFDMFAKDIPMIATLRRNNCVTFRSPKDKESSTFSSYSRYLST
jgi:hypothetical protein